MNFNKSHILFLILFTLFSIETFAQTLHTSYFLENAIFRHQMNPAFMGKSNYISIPLMGNINIGTEGNVGLSDFIYKSSGSDPKYDLTTFLSPDISQEEFLGNLNDNNKINANVDLTLLSTGFKAWGGFNTFGVGIRSNTDLNLPYELFGFIKKGLDDINGSTYHIKDLTARSNNYIEIALGHARSVNDNLTIGAKLKLLVGAANSEAKIHQMDILMSQDKWLINANGELRTSLSGASFKLKDNNQIDGLDYDSPGVAGLGAGLDLGAVYKLTKNFIVSGAVIDMGFISWKKTLKGVTHNNEAFVFDGFDNIAVNPDHPDNDPKSIDNQWSDISDRLEDMTRFYNEGETKSTTRLATTINVAGQYILPFYKKLSFGLLSSTRINKPYTSTEMMASVNISPLSWFETSVNYSYSTYGSSLGWMLNFHPRGMTFFIGTDHMLTSVSKQYVPLGNLNTNVSLGFNVTFGTRR